MCACTCPYYARARAHTHIHTHTHISTSKRLLPAVVASEPRPGALILLGPFFFFFLLCLGLGPVSKVNVGGGGGRVGSSGDAFLLGLSFLGVLLGLLCQRCSSQLN
jgi:hypothetical protein